MSLVASILGFVMMLFGIVVAFFIVFHVTMLISYGISSLLFKKNSMVKIYSITALFFLVYIAFCAYVTLHKDEPPTIYNTLPAITYDDDTIEDGNYNNEDQCFDKQGSYGC